MMNGIPSAARIRSRTLGLTLERALAAEEINPFIALMIQYYNITLHKVLWHLA